ncbi:hypothetical protein CC86DRAFT_401024 [Ophiobolus disseminans]|uniref:Uncharacterized protein n=1 Tax=Ophiobolus disseminans TaxID=1469910 RepID=A0A6A7AHV0_9PLEO|nr:hypothetical protein CC86DRAFT_401024 [Ophiobolus disseminans]
MSNPACVESAEIKRIERAADTLKATFLTFRDETWHTHIFDVQCFPENIFIFDDPNKSLRWQGWFSHYPEELVDTPDDRAAVLSAMASYDIAHLRKMIEQMLEGMDVILEEVLFSLNPPRRGTCISYGCKAVDLHDFDHWLIRITSCATGNQWAIDIAGAQYDSHISCIPWILACPKLISRTLAVLPFGTMERYAVAMADTKGTDGVEIDVQMKAMQAFHAAIDPGMARKKLSWAVILGKDEKDYVRHRDKILKKGTKAMGDFVLNSHLTKRRVKAERYEKRHFDELVEERNKICQDILGCQPRQVDACMHGLSEEISARLPSPPPGFKAAAVCEQRRIGGHGGE